MIDEQSLLDALSGVHSGRLRIHEAYRQIRAAETPHQSDLRALLKEAQDRWGAALDSEAKTAVIANRLGTAAYEAYAATGADTDGARNWRELFLPLKHPSWAEVLRTEVEQVVRERDEAEEKLEQHRDG